MSDKTSSGEPENRSWNRMMNRRKAIQSGLAGGVVALAGCSSLGGGDNDGSNSVSDDGSSDGESSDGESSGGSTSGNSSTTTIEFRHGDGGAEGEFFGSIVKDFNEQTDGIEVEMNIVQDGLLEGVLNAARSGGDVPEVTNLEWPNIKLLWDTNFFAPVEEFVNVNWDNYLEICQQNYKYNGTQVTINHKSGGTKTVYYNKDMFEEAGLPREQPPTTYKEVRRYAKEIVDQDIADFGMIGRRNAPGLVYAAMSQRGVPITNNANGRNGPPTEANYNNPATRDWYRWYKDMVDDGLYGNAGTGEIGTTASEQALINKTGAMIIKGASDYFTLNNQADFDVGTGQFPIPEDTKRRGTGYIGNGTLWVPDNISQSKKDAAGEFISYLTSPEVQTEMYKKVRYLPVRKETVDTLKSENYFEENEDAVMGLQQHINTQINTEMLIPWVGPMPEIREASRNTGEQILANDEIEPILDNANQRMTKALEEYQKRSQ